MTEAEVVQVKTLLRFHTPYTVANILCRPVTTIKDIAFGRTWKEVKVEIEVQSLEDYRKAA